MKPDEQYGKFRINLKKYRIFPANQKIDGMKVQSYSDRFPRHHILFWYRLPYEYKNDQKYKKTELKFLRILLTIFILTGGSSKRVPAPHP
jgi:hypothetical protein